jgi:hypothetical protein
MNVAGNALETEQDFGCLESAQNVLAFWRKAKPDHDTVVVGRGKFLFHCGLILNPAFPEWSAGISRLLQLFEQSKPLPTGTLPFLSMARLSR